MLFYSTKLELDINETIASLILERLGYSLVFTGLKRYDQHLINSVSYILFLGDKECKSISLDPDNNYKGRSCSYSSPYLVALEFLPYNDFRKTALLVLAGY